MGCLAGPVSSWPSGVAMEAGLRLPRAAPCQMGPCSNGQGAAPRALQSTPLRRGRAELEERAARLEAQYADESIPVPRPPVRRACALGGPLRFTGCAHTVPGCALRAECLLRRRCAHLCRRRLPAYVLLTSFCVSLPRPAACAALRSTGEASCCARWPSSSGRAAPAACTTACATCGSLSTRRSGGWSGWRPEAGLALACGAASATWPAAPASCAALQCSGIILHGAQRIP